MHSHSGSGSTPAFTPQGKALGDGLANTVADHVVHQLGHRSRADFSGVENLVAEGVQQGLDPVEDLPLSTNHDGQVAALCAALAPADGRVEYMDTLGTELDLQFANQGGTAG